MLQHVGYQHKYCKGLYYYKLKIRILFQITKYYFLIKIFQITPIAIAQMSMCFQLRLIESLLRKKGMEQPIPIKKPSLLSSTRTIKKTNKQTAKSTLRTHKYALRTISSSGYMKTILVVTRTRLFTSLDMSDLFLSAFVLWCRGSECRQVFSYSSSSEISGTCDSQACCCCGDLNMDDAVVISIWVMSVFDSLSMSSHAIFTHLL